MPNRARTAHDLKYTTAFASMHHITTRLLLQGRTVLSHDYVFWCGDFNYRINMERDQVIDMVNKKVTLRI